MRYVVLNDFADFQGGATAMARFQAEGLARRGAEVLYLSAMAPTPGHAAPAGCRAVSLELADVRARGAAAGAIAGVYSGAAAARLSAALDRHAGPDAVVLLHQWTRAFSPAVFKPLAQRPVLVFAHDYFLACPNGAYFHFPPERLCDLAPMSLACITAGCDRESRLHKAVRVVRHAVQDRLTDRLARAGVAFVSQGQADRYASIFPSPLKRFVIENIPVSDPQAGETPAAAPPRDGVLFVGRLTAEKGPVALARAARAAGVGCAFVGDGPEAAALRAGFPECEITPWLPRDAVFARMRAARALMFPSAWPETFGLVAAEAAALGLPIAVGQAVTTAKTLERLGLGHVFDPKDETAFVRTLRLIGSAGWAPYLEAAGRYAAAYDWAAARDGYFDALEHAAATLIEPAENDGHCE